MNIRSVKFQTFTKTFEGLGEMTAISTSEKKCMSWNKHIDLGLWSNVKVIAHRVLVENPDLLAMVSKELRLAEQNGRRLSLPLRNTMFTKKVLKKISTLLFLMLLSPLNLIKANLEILTLM